jgi:PAS domain S-box-containing protein
MKENSWRKFFWPGVIIIFTAGIVLATVFSLSKGSIYIFPYIYIIPIILIARIHPRFAIYFTIAIGWIYIGLVYFFGQNNIGLFATAVAWFFIFVTLGVVISSMVNTLKHEEMFRNIFSNSQAGIFAFNQGLAQIQEINDKAAHMLGYEPDELRNMPITTIMPDTPERVRFFTRLEKERTFADMELLFSKKDSTTLLALVSASLGSDSTVICSVVDITERERMKNIISTSELKYRTLFDSASDAIFIHDFDGRIFETNQIACDEMGYSREEIVALNIKDLDTSTDSRKNLYPIEDKTPPATIIFETVYRCKNGHLIPTEVSSRVIRYRSDNAIMSMIRDITERKQAEAALRVFDWNVRELHERINDLKQAEAALRESEKRYRMVGELIPYGVWMADESGNFTYLSGSFLNLLGITLAESANAGWIQHLPREDQDRTLTDWKQCVLTGGSWDYEYRIIDREEKEHFVLSRGSPLCNDAAKIISWVGIHLDITERRRYQNRLETSLREKEVIIKEVHHRVKNNMQVISGFLLLQSNYITDPLSIEKLNESQQRVKTMALVHEKLYQSKSLEFISTADYIKSLITDLIDSSVINPGIDVRVNIEPVSINIDIAIPIGLIINELVTNALKHAFKNRSTGIISINLELCADHRFTLVVQDDGEGLPHDFDTRTTSSLGMQLVTVLTRQLGGEMKTTSQNGARFEISFPEKF